MTHSISGVILAGGASKRLNGLTKSKIVIGGETIISRMVNTIKDIFSEIIIVTNTPEEYQEFRNYKIVGDQILNIGPLGGIDAALKASSCEAVFVFAGDMPLIDKRLIVRQIEFYNTGKCDILIPQIADFIEPLHSIYSISVLAILEKYLNGKDDYAVREFIKMTNVKYFQLEITDENIQSFTNVNSPYDRDAVEKILGKL
jgi:molybdenum cofactor guanylyltransferase